MKHDAIVGQGIPIHERIPIPEELIPADSRVEIDAKIHAGSVVLFSFSFLFLPTRVTLIAMLTLCQCRYFTTGKVMTMEELSAVQGRAWGTFYSRDPGCSLVVANTKKKDDVDH